MAQDDARLGTLGGLLTLALLAAFWPSGAAAQTCDAPFMTDLVTGTGIHVGHVKVCNDADKLTVTYETTYPWCVTKTNLDVAKDLAGIPKTVLATPNWLRFDIVEVVDCEGEVPYDVPLADVGGGVEAGDTVTIAARAVVDGGNANKKACLLGDTCVAWGAGTRFRPRLPATYFTYTVQEPYLCGVGGTSGCVFMASAYFSADFVSAASDLLGTTPSDSLAAGDALCQHFAEAQGSKAAPGTYVAWLSTGGDAIRDRLITPSGPYLLVDGTQVVQHGADITSGTLENGIDRDQTGQLYLHGVQVWTGTSVTGASSGQDCNSWSSTSANVGGTHGLEGLNDGRWTDNGNFNCGGRLSLYCFQQGEQ